MSRHAAAPIQLQRRGLPPATRHPSGRHGLTHTNWPPRNPRLFTLARLGRTVRSNRTSEAGAGPLLRAQRTAGRLPRNHRVPSSRRPAQPAAALLSLGRTSLLKSGGRSDRQATNRRQVDLIAIASALFLVSRQPQGRHSSAVVNRIGRQTTPTQSERRDSLSVLAPFGPGELCVGAVQ